MWRMLDFNCLSIRLSRYALQLWQGDYLINMIYACFTQNSITAGDLAVKIPYLLK